LTAASETQALARGSLSPPASFTTLKKISSFVLPANGLNRASSKRNVTTSNMRQRQKLATPVRSSLSARAQKLVDRLNGTSAKMSWIKCWQSPKPSEQNKTSKNDST
jgi:hypothetical protein